MKPADPKGAGFYVVSCRVFEAYCHIWFVFKPLMVRRRDTVTRGCKPREKVRMEWDCGNLASEFLFMSLGADQWFVFKPLVALL